jgi:A/G-specific adenine glycosylase
VPANRLLEHYVDNARRLPWRAMPGEPTPDPYRVWLSEVMLQQTTVAAVTPRFERFLARWPTVEALAAAPDEDVLSEWAGLGYYARARNLIACAREVAERGGFPDTEEELRKLPGIGGYTAAAISAIAFGRRAVVIDTNVERVVARLHGIDVPIAEAKDRVRELADALTPQDRAGDFAQAMMDLGATICRPRAPECIKCPLSPDCKAFASGEPERFSAPKRKTARPVRHGVARWIERDGCIWLVRRPAKGMLGGMAALPGSEWTDDAKAAGPMLGAVTHVFTHFRLELSIVAGAEPAGEGWWQPLSQISDAGLPTLYRRAIDAVLESRTKLAA